MLVLLYTFCVVGLVKASVVSPIQVQHEKSESGDEVVVQKLLETMTPILLAPSLIPTSSTPVIQPSTQAATPQSSPKTTPQTTLPQTSPKSTPKTSLKTTTKITPRLRVDTGDNETEDEAARVWLNWFNRKAKMQYYINAVAKWQYQTGISADTAANLTEAVSILAAFESEALKQAWKFNLSRIRDPFYYRQIWRLQRYSMHNITGWNKSMSATLTYTMSQMTAIFNTNPICSWQNYTKNCTVKWALHPDITNIFMKERDYDLLTYVWKEWRERVSRRIRPFFATYVTLQNKRAKMANFSDMGDVWRSWYEQENFTREIEQIYYQILPLYEQLHAYVRRKISQEHGSKRIHPERPIPAHLLGNTMAADWTNLFRLLPPPYPHKPTIDVTDAMLRQNYTVRRMFEMADDFFVSIGMKPVNENFWNGSILVKPTDGRSMVCHASAWDFFDKDDYRIKMCTKINMNDLIVVHHEMGHIQYFMQYADLPMMFRMSANPGFHEAIGDTIALSVSIPDHLKAVGLLPDYVRDTEQDTNYLYKQALHKVAFLPYAYMLELWRWRVFDGTYATPDDYNKGWWDLRYQMQGVRPPLPRSHTVDFDPGAKTHVAEGTPYIRYFVAHIVQFQFYKALCDAAGYKGQLHHCDFYNSKEAGRRLADMLRLGASVPWTEAMRNLTGQAHMSADAILEYFQPLYDWLRRENRKQGNCYGWGYQWPKEVMKTLETPRCSLQEADRSVDDDDV